MKRVEVEGWLVPVAWIQDAKAMGQEVRRKGATDQRTKAARMRDGDVISGDEILREGLKLDERLHHYDDEQEHQVHEDRSQDASGARPRGRRSGLFAPGELLEGLDPGSLVDEMHAARRPPRPRRRPASTAELRKALPGLLPEPS